MENRTPLLVIIAAILLVSIILLALSAIWGSSASIVWSVAVLVTTAFLAGVLFYSGLLSGSILRRTGTFWFRDPDGNEFGFGAVQRRIPGNHALGFL